MGGGEGDRERGEVGVGGRWEAERREVDAAKPIKLLEFKSD